MGWFTSVFKGTKQVETDYPNQVIDKCRSLNCGGSKVSLTEEEIKWIERRAKSSNTINYNLSDAYKVATGKSLSEINPNLMTFGLTNRYEKPI